MKPPLILFLIALILRVAAIVYWQFDGLYGQDPYAYYRQALAIVDRLPQAQPPPADFFWPNGYPLLMALFTLLTGQQPLAGQLAALLCGSLLPPLAYLICKELWPNEPGSRSAGILAGLIIAVAGQPILSSVVIMADMPALFWAALAAWSALKAGQPGRSTWWLLLAGASLGLAIISRWVYLLAVPALAGYVLFGLSRRRLRWWTPLPVIAGGGLILTPQLWLTLSGPGNLAHSWLVGWHPANFLSRQFENIDGHFSYPLPVGVYYAQPAGHPAYIFPLLGLAGLWAIWRLAQTRQWAALILLAGWAGPVYLFLGGIPYQNFRFGLTLYLPLALLTGYGLADILNRLRGRLLALARLIIALSLLGMLAWSYPMLNNFLSAQNYGKAVARQVELTLPPQATLITFGLTLTFQHYTRLNTLELFHLDEAALDRLLQSHAPLYLLLDVGNIETQWRDKLPRHNYRWLVEHSMLVQAGRFPPYTLFKVERQRR